MKHTRRRGWKHWLAALVLFGCGMAVGAGGTVWSIQKRIREHHQNPPGHVADRVMRRLDRQLALTPEQERPIRAIVEERLVALRAVRDDAMPRVSAELTAAREAIAAELDAEQEARWRKHFARLEQMLPPLAPRQESRGIQRPGR